MTYALMPRNCESGEVLWDDPRNGVFDVVKVEPPSEYRFKLIRGARVLIRREYLQDYATVRDMSMIQTYYVANSDDSPDPVSTRLAKEKCGHLLRLPQRAVDIRFDARDRELVLAQVWGSRHLLAPAHAPVSDNRDYGVLHWPGYGAIDGSAGISPQGSPLTLGYVYVRDSVLGEYEGRPGFEITPESGAVSCRGQWSVSFTQRVGRDLIQVELKKLYEGNPPTVVKTWHKYAVDAPDLDGLAALRSQPNIARRAKAVVYAVVRLGEVLAGIASEVTDTPRTACDLVKLERARLEHEGWWSSEAVEPITRHVPIAMMKGDFMSRCVDLYKVVGECLSEKILRQTLISLGIDKEDIKDLRSLRLLERLVQLAGTAERTGLDLVSQGQEVEARRKESPPSTPVTVLIHLCELRNSKSHRGRSAKQALKDLGICIQKTTPGWGEALDTIYDGTAQALLGIADALLAGTASLM